MPAGNNSEPQKKPPLSCTSCRTRKLKCDKQDPCRHCARSGSECIFPTRKRIQRPRRTKNAELLQRLSRLESIVGQVGLKNLEAAVEDAHNDDDEGEEEKTEKVAVSVSTSSRLPATQYAAPWLPPAAATGGGDNGNDEVGGDDADSNNNTTALCGIKDTRPPQDGTALRYMSGEFWSSLCDEVGGLRQTLEQATDSEDNDDDEDDDDDGYNDDSNGGAALKSTDSSPGLLALSKSSDPQTGVSSAIIAHPSPVHIRYLAAIYFRNVDLHLKILHRPTTLAALHQLADDPNSETASAKLSPERTALFFAMYYAAVSTLTDTECACVFEGRSRAYLAATYRSEIDRALTAADYLNTTSLETLQALTLYACCLRSNDGSRAAWVMLGLPIRLAQAMDLHRDGDGETSRNGGARFTPFEAEQRRRLWWQLIVLDIRAAEDRATIPIIAHGSYDTRLPHNLDDDEFGPYTTAPLRDRPGPSDTTFSLFTAQSSGMSLWPDQTGVNSNLGGISDNDGEHETLLRRARHLESRFIKDADPTHVGSYLASVIGRIIIMRMWLAARYPLRPRGGVKSRTTAVSRTTPETRKTSGEAVLASGTSYSHDDNHDHVEADLNILSSGSSSATPAAIMAGQSTLRTATSVMELAHSIDTGPYADRTRWWCDTYVQWHALSVALAELCTQTQGPIVERAWRIIEIVFPLWSHIIADTKRGSLWRPIRKLYKKARAAREEAISSIGGSNAPPDMVDGLQQSRHPTLTQNQIQLSNIGPGIDYIATNPVFATEFNSVRPRLITDLHIYESSAQVLISDSPTPYANMASLDLGINVMGNPALRPSQLPYVETDANTGDKPISFDLNAIMSDPGQSMSQALLSWPDVTFDMPADPSTGIYNDIPSQARAPLMDSTVTGEESIMVDPLPPGVNMMNWSTWDEFVSDTFADSTSNAGSRGSEGGGPS